MRKSTFSLLFAILVIALFALLFTAFAAPVESDNTKSQDTLCENCHLQHSPGLVGQWKDSKHAENDITCIDCHKAEASDADAFKHGGKTIATLVTPKDCGKCHEQQMEEVSNSYHAIAGQILDSNDAYLAHVAGGEPVAIVGCVSCHGSKIEIDERQENKLSLKTWPNSGIGRINPDGSSGSCVACHTRHTFSAAQARQPEACSKCHLGPDHPQKEVYEASKHGNAYFTNKDKMNLNSDNWVVGIDYNVAPTCATCHMSETSTQPITHDVGKRISWTLRPIVSVKKDNWEKKRANMRDVCSACHGGSFADGHYYQFDAVVELYNEKFAKPSKALMDMIKNKNLLENPANFGNKIEWTFWEIWHHEGRVARHGAAMMAPDYAWWHGIYEVAQHFYFKYIPEARELHDPDVDAFLDNLLTNDPMHNWMSKQTGNLKAAINSGKMQELYQSMYKKKK